MCLSTPKMPAMPGMPAAPHVDEFNSSIQEARIRARRARGAFGNIFGGGLGTTGPGAYGTSQVAATTMSAGP